MSTAYQVSAFSGTLTPTVLGSSAAARDHGIEDITGDEQRDLEVVKLPRLAQPKVFDRTVRSEGLTIKLQRVHATQADALIYWFRHPSTCPIVVDLLFEQDNASAWLNGCGIQSVRRVQRQGVTTWFEYQIVGGAWDSNRGNPPS